jgi:hypothetical protein
MGINKDIATHADLAPDEILRQVRMRFRICNYLFNASAIWILLGYLVFACSAFARSPGDGSNGVLGASLIAVGFGLFTAAFALTLAIYRCPVCDKYLSRFRPDKLHCPRCNAQVRLPK